MNRQGSCLYGTYSDWENWWHLHNNKRGLRSSMGWYHSVGKSLFPELWGALSFPRWVFTEEEITVMLIYFTFHVLHLNRVQRFPWLQGHCRFPAHNKWGSWACQPFLSMRQSSEDFAKTKCLAFCLESWYSSESDYCLYGTQGQWHHCSFPGLGIWWSAWSQGLEWCLLFANVQGGLGWGPWNEASLGGRGGLHEVSRSWVSGEGLLSSLLLLSGSTLVYTGRAVFWWGLRWYLVDVYLPGYTSC